MKLSNITPAFIEYHALKGTFGRVSYFATKTSLRDAAENLALLPQEGLSFRERIQRLIDTERVESELLPYLRRDEYRFFNSIVCILLPDPSQKIGYWEFNEYTDDSGNLTGGIGKLRISKDISRVVLDGQHRFAALKMLWEQERDILALHPEMEVPLVFIIADDLGRTGTTDINYREDTINVVRHLFTVINRTAKKVDKNTLLLIDDYDLFNVLARRVIEEELLTENSVKWTGGENLGDHDPYFITLHTVRDVVKYFLEPHIAGKASSGMERNQIERLSTRLFDQAMYGKFSAKELISDIFSKSLILKLWNESIEKFEIKIPQQPDVPSMSAEQKKKLAHLRKSELGFTVAGQKAFYFAIITAFLHGSSHSRDALNACISRANAVVGAKLFSRTRKNTNPFFGVLLDDKARMLWSNNQVDLARRMLAFAIGAKINREAVTAEFIKVTDRDANDLDTFWKECRHVQEKEGLL